MHVRQKIHGYALRNQKQAAQDRHRQQNPEKRANQISPKISKRGSALARVTANESDPYREARRAGEKVLPREDELTEVTHCCLACVGLPCCRGRKADRGIRREIRRHRRGHYVWKE